MTALLAVAVKGLVVLLAAALAARVLRGASASTRHGIWAVAFAALALLPVLEMAGPRWSVGVWPAAEAVSLAPPAPPPPPVPPPPPPAPPPGFGHSLLAHEHQMVVFEHHVEAFDREMEAFDREMEAFDQEMDAFDDRMEWFEPEALVAASRSRWAPLALTHTASRAGGWVVGLWGVGALAVGLGWLAALLAARRLVAGARPEADDEWAVQAERARRLVGLAAPVRLLRSDALDVPVAWGWGRGAVVLPASADAWDEDRREAVLLHELAHLARRDAWSQAVAQLALAVHWFNPLAWRAYRRFLDAREHACDDAVLRSRARPSAYAEHLVHVARAVRRDRLALAGLAPMARTAPVRARVVSILDPGRVRGRMGRVSGAALVLLATGVLAPLAALQPVAQTPDDSWPFAEAAELTGGDLDSGVEIVGPDSDDWADIEDAIAHAEDGMEWIEGDAELVGEMEPLNEMASLEQAEALDLGEVASGIDGDLDQARARIRSAIRDLERADGPQTRLQIDALRQAEAGLAQIDRQALREQAREAVRSSAALGARRPVGAGQRLPPPPPSPPLPPPTPTPTVRSPAPPSIDWADVDRARQAAQRRRSR